MKEASISSPTDEGHARPQGPFRRLEKKFGSPMIVDDGVTIAKDIELEQPPEHGRPALKEVASKTTTSPETAPPPRSSDQSLLAKGSRTSRPAPTQGHRARHLHKALEVVVKELKKNVKPVKTKEEKAQVPLSPPTTASSET